MVADHREVERAKAELIQLSDACAHLEKRIRTLHDLLRAATSELFGVQQQVGMPEATLAARIAEAVVSQMTNAQRNPGIRKTYVREREAAEYMGIRVTTLRARRVRRSETGPPFVRLGRMILYPLAELENHVQAGLVPARRK